MPLGRPDLGNCWVWLAALAENGYGMFGGPPVRKAHQWAWENAHGPRPTGLVLDHLCRNRACVRVTHLELVTQRENILRGVGVVAQAARATECPKGHPYDEANTISVQRPNRQHPERRCRICVNAWARAGHHARKARQAGHGEPVAVGARHAHDAG